MVKALIDAVYDVVNRGEAAWDQLVDQNEAFMAIEPKLLEKLRNSLDSLVATKP